MSGKSMAELSRNLSSLCKYLGGERGKFIPILFMASEGEHLRTQTHELNAIFIIPANHFHDITCIGQTKGLHMSLTSGNIGRFVFIWSILGWMLRLGRIL